MVQKIYLESEKVKLFLTKLDRGGGGGTHAKNIIFENSFRIVTVAHIT